MKCLIIAAGQGTRIKKIGTSKPLIPLLGLRIIERVVSTLYKGGINDFYVVTGYNGESVRAFLDSLSKKFAIHMTHIINDEWQSGNGLSVLKAKEIIQDNFILVMGDHLFSVDLINEIKEKTLLESEVILAVDKNVNNPLVDIGDVTKVEVNGDKVINIGKDLKNYNGFDTGIFLCTPGIFQGIERSIGEHQDTSLSGGIRFLAAEGRVKTFDIRENFWIDLDTPFEFKKAEQLLMSQTSGKQKDGPVSKYINRPVSRFISRSLLKTPVTPNQISFFSFILSAFASLLFIAGSYKWLLIGGILAQLSSIVDGCDGEIARLKQLQSNFGGWFDAILDRYGDALLIFGLTWHYYSMDRGSYVYFLGFAALIGSIMISYSAERYDSFEHKYQIRLRNLLPLSRDVRIFFVFLGTLFNQPLLILVTLALLTNLKIFTDIYAYYKRASKYEISKNERVVNYEISIPANDEYSKVREIA